MDQQVHFCKAPDGARLAYALVGQGPHLLYLGWCVTHLELEWEDPALRAFFEKLGQYHTILRYDRRGSGLSDREKKDFSLQAELQDLEAIINHLKLGELAILGTHRGGPLAVTYTMKYPESVTKLILYGSYRFQDHGIYSLKGIPGEWRLFDVKQTVCRQCQSLVSKKGRIRTKNE
jgi:pimeloyl-ACP methyl ester carboxylesterase